jgi:hypothetical protein
MAPPFFTGGFVLDQSGGGCPRRDVHRQHRRPDEGAEQADGENAESPAFQQKREPVTIELGPDQVSRLSDSAEPNAPETDFQAADSNPRDEIAAKAGDDDAARETGTVEDQGNDREAAPPRAGADDAADREAPSADPAGSAPMASVPLRGGFGRPLAAGIAGGVIALLLAGGLQWAGFIPALEDAGQADALQSLRGDVAALEQKVASFDASAIDAETIKQALAPVDKRIEELTADLDKVKTDAATARPADESADPAVLKSVQDQISRLEQGVAAASKAAPSTQTVDALGQKVASLDRSTAANSDALKNLQERVAALGGKVAEQASEPNATAAIAASALKSAIERGGSFAAELDMFAAIAPDTPELAELRALAATGVPTRAQLAAGVAAVAERMLDATRETAGREAGVVDRLLASARSLVKVRPVGTIEGDGVPAGIARFREAVIGGDLAAAAESYNGLPEKAKAAGADFMAGLQARLKVDALAQKALASALKTG